MKEKYAQNILNTTIEGINVGTYYKFNNKNNCIQIIYNETDKYYQSIFGTKQWFDQHFKIFENKGD